jgi:hypothetical protein
MNFLIADTFTESLAHLTAQEQKAAKTTAFDLQMDPSAPGLSFHKLDRAKDQNFWSVRVNADIRLIAHRTPSSLLLAYVAHHDPAYKWAERRKIERHPTTGAMQLVEVRERVEEVVPRVAGAVAKPQKPKLFGNLRKNELMAFGVPAEWVNDVRAADEDTLFDVITHLPQEAQEALLKLWPSARSRKRRRPRLSRPTRSPIRTHCAASAFSTMSRRCAARWTSHGRNGPSSCIPRRQRSWRGTSLAPRASQGRQAPAKRW